MATHGGGPYGIAMAMNVAPWIRTDADNGHARRRALQNRNGDECCTVIRTDVDNGHARRRALQNAMAMKLHRSPS